MQLEIPGVTIKPYVRMTKRGKYVDPQALQYLASKDELAFHIKSGMRRSGCDMLPKKTPLRVLILVTVPASQGHRADLDNIVKAVLDAGNGIAYPDDRWVDEIKAVRYIGEPNLKLLIEVA